MRRLTATLGTALLALIAFTALATSASATVTGTLNAATLSGQHFTWTCDVNPGGATIDVTGAAWLTVDGSQFVESAKQRISGTTSQRLTFSYVGQPNLNYTYRCKWYNTAGTLLGKTSTLTITTTKDTGYGLDVETISDPGGNTAANWELLYNNHRAWAGGNLGVRIYSGTTPPLATDSTVDGQFMSWIAANHPSEPVTVSFKSYDATRFNSLMTWAQGLGMHLTVIYFHEPQDDCGNGNQAACPTTYKSVYATMRSAINAHPWHAHVTLEKCLMWYWQQYQAASHPGTSWTDYVDPAVNGVKQDPADVVSWDPYQESWLTTYDAPATFMQYPLAVYNSAKVDWGYEESGSVILSGDTTHNGWVNFIENLANYAQTPSLAGTSYNGLPPALFVKYWCNNGDTTTDPPYHLEQDSRAQNFWAGLVQSKPLT